MNTRAIDFITEDFYESLCFMDSEAPDLETAIGLFYGEGLIINNSFAKPKIFTAASFKQAIETQIEKGQLDQFLQRELYSKTEIFGKIALRISIYEYSFSYYETENATKGTNYIQFAQVDDIWKITSMMWCDESENHKVPADWDR